MKKSTLNPWAVTTLVCLVFVVCNGFDSIGPNVPSLFSRIISTNKTADAWRTALSVPSATSLTAVSNAQVATAANLVTVSNAQVTTAGNLVTVSNAQITTAANLLSVSNAQITTAANLLTVSNAQVTTDGKLIGYVTNNAGTATNAALTGGTMTSVTNLDLTASRVMVSDANKVPTSSSVTATTLGYLDATSSVQTQLDSKPTVALASLARLDQSQVFTGTTNIFGGNVQVTNFANFARTRVIFETNNFFFPNLATNGAGFAGGNTTNTLTNLWINSANFIPSNIFTITLPALRSTNETISIQYELVYTNARPSASYGLVISLGTNRVQIANPIGSTGASYPYHRIPTLTGTLMAMEGSFTNQIAGNASPSSSAFMTVSSSFTNATYVDPTQPWNMTFEWGAQTAVAYELTNTFCRYFRVVATTPADTRVVE